MYFAGLNVIRRADAQKIKVSAYYTVSFSVLKTTDLHEYPSPKTPGRKLLVRLLFRSSCVSLQYSLSIFLSVPLLRSSVKQPMQLLRGIEYTLQD